MNIKEILLDNTIYTTRKEIEDTIDNLINGWINSRDKTKDLYILMNGWKVGSMQWLYLRYRYTLPEHTILLTGGDSIDIRGNSEYLLLDDWILSGCNYASIIDSMFSLESFLSVENTYITSISSICTDGGISVISGTRESIDMRFMYDRRIDNLDTILGRMGINPRSRDILDFYEKYNPDTCATAYPIYSDYKIPNGFGSFPLIYKDLIVPDREFMKEVQKEWNNYV